MDHAEGSRGTCKTISTALSLSFLVILKSIHFSITCSAVRVENNQPFSQRHPSNWVDASEDEDDDDEAVEATPPHNEDY